MEGIYDIDDDENDADLGNVAIVIAQNSAVVKIRKNASLL